MQHLQKIRPRGLKVKSENKRIGSVWACNNILEHVVLQINILVDPSSENFNRSNLCFIGVKVAELKREKVSALL
jgi:hypothetical protein